MRRTTAALAIFVLALLGCAPIEDADPRPRPSPPPATDAAPLDAPADIDPFRVLLAVVVLAAGDVELAIASGMVTPEEVDLADAAIDADTTAQWFERARSDLARR